MNRRHDDHDREIEDSLRTLICRLLNCCRHHEPGTRVEWTLRAGDIETTFEGDWIMAMKIGQTFTATVEFLDKNGKPAKRLDGIPAWVIDDVTIAKIDSTSDDGKTVHGSCVSDGATTLRVSVDADLGAGMREVTGSGTIEVDPDEAESASITITPDAPTP